MARLRVKSTNKPKSIIVLKTEEVSVDGLNTFYKNPRRGNVQKIADSIKANGQYRAIVVNVGTKTGRPNEVLAGNHTFLGMKQAGGETILASFVDVSDEEAKKIVLADNRLGDLGTYDDKVLADLMDSLPRTPALYASTGYAEAEVDDILSVLDRNADQSREFLNEVAGAIEDTDDAEDYEGVYQHDRVRYSDNLEVGEEDEDGLDEGRGDRGIDSADESLGGAYQLQDEVFFEEVWGRWEIPKFRRDMLMTREEWPDKITSWAGGASRDTPENSDPDHWWFYNYGISSTSGMRYRDNMILSFYAWDNYFMKWWHQPAKYTSKALNTGVQYAVTPNFSTWVGYPAFTHLEALYRNRWLGRYFQEAGIKIIPNLEWAINQQGEEFLKDYVLKSLPKNMPMISIQGNVVVDSTRSGASKSEVEQQKKDVARQYRIIVDTITPGAIVFYGAPRWIEFIEDLKLNCEIIPVVNHMTHLAEYAKKKEKNTGL